jgi:hypothetical protein
VILVGSHQQTTTFSAGSHEGFVSAIYLGPTVPGVIR